MDIKNSKYGLSTNIIGIDEVGRGSLAGVATICAYRFKTIPENDVILALNDSKKLSAKKRELLDDTLRRLGEFIIHDIDAHLIDTIGIGKALDQSMIKAALMLDPNYKKTILVDGNRPLQGLPNCHAIVKGDGSEPSIAAASILAKNHRDNIMRSLDGKYPLYGFCKHVGYGTKMHREAIIQYGPIENIHRKSFLGKILRKNS